VSIHTDGKDTVSNAPRVKTTRIEGPGARPQTEGSSVSVPTYDAILIAKLARTEVDCGTAGSEAEVLEARGALERLEEKLST
jgi:hypothetical protein